MQKPLQNTSKSFSFQEEFPKKRRLQNFCFGENKRIRSRLFSFQQKTTDPIFFNFSFEKNRLKSVVSWFLENHGQYKTLQLLEKFKEYGFGYATKAGISLGIDDLKIPAKKVSMIWQAETKVAKDFSEYRNAKITGVERTQRLMYTWNQTNDLLKQEVVQYFEKRDLFNPIYMMAFSGARGNMSQVRQLVGMRGLMSDPQGQIIDFPIQSNFREGLTLTEYLISTYGARKGIVDTALRTATAGYLTRRLVDVAQHVLVSQFDCGTRRGIFLFDMKDANKTIYSFQNRLVGRVLAQDIRENGNFVASRNQEVDSACASAVSKITKKALVRSPLTCETPRLVCQLCYGWSLSQGKLVSIGEAVGVIAAQSIGEPGTQLTMRTFHTGGVFAGGLTDQILAPFDGKISYVQTIPGSCIRTSLSEIAFFTKAPGSFFVFHENKHTPKHDNTHLSFSEIYKVPASALLFFRKNETLQKNQVLAQFSTVSKKQLQYGTVEQTLFSTLAGEFYFQTSLLPFSQKPESKKIELFLEKRTDEDALLSTLEFKNDILWKVKHWTNIWILSGKILFQPFESNVYFRQGDLLQKTTVFQRILWKKRPNCELFLSQDPKTKTGFFQNSEKEKSVHFAKKPFCVSRSELRLLSVPKVPFFLNFQNLYLNQREKNRKFLKNTSDGLFSSKIQNFGFLTGSHHSQIFHSLLLGFQFSKFAKKFQTSQKFVKVLKGSSMFFENFFHKAQKNSFNPILSEPSFSPQFSSPKSRSSQKKKFFLPTLFSFSEKKVFEPSFQSQNFQKKLSWKKPMFSFDFEKIRYKDFSYVFSSFSRKKNSKIFFRTFTALQESFGGSILQKGHHGNLVKYTTLTTENFYGAQRPKFFTSCFFENFQTSTNGIFSLLSFENLPPSGRFPNTQNMRIFPFPLFSSMFPKKSNSSFSFVPNIADQKRFWRFQNKKEYTSRGPMAGLDFSFFQNSLRNSDPRNELYTSEILWIPQETYSFQTVLSFEDFQSFRNPSSFFVGKNVNFFQKVNKQGKIRTFRSGSEGIANFSIRLNGQTQFPFFLEQKISVRKSFSKCSDFSEAELSFQKNSKKTSSRKTSFQYLKFHSFFAFSKKRKSIQKPLSKKVGSSFSGFPKKKQPKKNFSFLFEKRKTLHQEKIQHLFVTNSSSFAPDVFQKFPLVLPTKIGKKMQSKCFTCVPILKNNQTFQTNQTEKIQKKPNVKKTSVSVKVHPGWVCFFPKAVSIFDWHQTLHQKGHFEKNHFCFEHTNVFSEACVFDVLGTNPGCFFPEPKQEKKDQQVELGKKKTFSPQLVVRKNSSPFLSFSEAKDFEDFQDLLKNISVFEDLQGSSFSKKSDSFSFFPEVLRKSEANKTKNAGILLRPIYLKALENSKALKKFDETFQAVSFSESSSLNLFKKYRSSDLNIQNPKKNAFSKADSAGSSDFVLYSGFPPMYHTKLKKLVSNSVGAKKKATFVFPKNHSDHNFQQLLSRRHFPPKSGKNMEFLSQKGLQKKHRKKNAFPAFFSKHTHEYSFFSFYPLQLLPLFSQKNFESGKKETYSHDFLSLAWDPFQSKATFSEVWSKSAFFEQRFFWKKKKNVSNSFSSFWLYKTERNFLLQSSPVNKESPTRITAKTKKTSFLKNSLYLKNATYFGNTKIYTPFDGEVLSMYTNETNWWKKAAEISTLQKFSSFFSVVTKKDLFCISFLDEKDQNLSTFFPKKQFFSETVLPEKQKNLDFLYSFLLEQSQSCREKFNLLEQSKTSFEPTQHSISSLFKYQKKIYTFKNLKIGFPFLKKDPELGKFYVYGDCFFQRVMTKPGQCIHVSCFSGTFRKGQPFLVSPQGFLHFSNTPYIQKNRPILTLPYQTVQSGDIVQGIPKVEQLFEARTTVNGRLFLTSFPILLKGIFHRYKSFLPLDQAVRQSFLKIQQLLVDGVQRVYRSQGVSIVDKHVEIIVRQMTTKVQIIHGAQTGFFPGELVNFTLVEKMNKLFLVKIRYEPILLGITRASLEVESFLSASSFQQTTKILALASISRKKDFLKGLKENILVGNLIPSGTGYVVLRKDI